MVYITQKQSYLFFLAISSILQNNIAKIITTAVTTELSELSGDWELCPEGKYATVFQLKRIESGNFFGVGLTSIALYCNFPSGVDTSFRITSHEGVLGSWGDEFFCEGLLTGFASTRTDGPALANFKGFCASHNSDKTAIEGDGKFGGNWTDGVKCLPKQAICGLRVHHRLLFWLSNGDEITNIEMKCCDIPNPAANCKAHDRWVRVLDFDNMEVLSPASISFKNAIGITTSFVPFSNYLDLKILALIGFTTEDAIPFIVAALTENLDKESKVHHKWSSESSETWSTKMTNELQEFQVVVEGGKRVLLYQVVGQCGGYIILSGRFKRIEADSRAVGNVTISEFSWTGDKMVPISKDLVKSL